MPLSLVDLPDGLLLRILHELNPLELVHARLHSVRARRLVQHNTRLRARSALRYGFRAWFPDGEDHLLARLSGDVINQALIEPSRTGDGLVIQVLLHLASHLRLRVRIGWVMHRAQCNGHLKLRDWLGHHRTELMQQGHAEWPFGDVALDAPADAPAAAAHEAVLEGPEAPPPLNDTGADDAGNHMPLDHPDGAGNRIPLT